MQEAIKGRFEAFLVDPNRQTYLEVFQAITSREDYDPYSGEMTQLDRWYQANQYREIVRVGYEIMDRWLLTPRIHILLARAHQGLGDAGKAQMEASLASVCLTGIQSTGDGSAQSAYVVTCTHDEYDVLAFQRRQSKSQRLLESGGKAFDVLTCTDGAEVWFDITVPYEKIGKMR